MLIECCDFKPYSFPSKSTADSDELKTNYASFDKAMTKCVKTSLMLKFLFAVCYLLTERFPEIEIGERPIPISYARHRVLSEKQKPASGQAEPEHSHFPSEYQNNRAILSTTLTSVTEPVRAPARAEGQKPRVVGPPIRRPKPKPKTTSGSGSGSTGPASYKTGGSGNGNCPPGNEATRDAYGKLILCNGLEPNCPPRSYCYITSGGFATEEYNCCKSW